MSKSIIDRVRLRAAEILTEYNSDEDLSAASFRESLSNALGMASTGRVGLAVVWNTLMIVLGVAVAVQADGYLQMAGVAWAIFNGYPFLVRGWRWLNGR